MKSFLRSLPQPIIPVKSFFADFLVSSNIQDEKIFISYLGSLVKLLPEMNYTLLKYLCNFFHEFTQFYKVNKMGAQNLAIIFAPSFFGQSDITDSTALVLETTVTSKITKTLIEKYDEIFINETHIPISRTVAYESYCDPSENWSIIKGEDVLVLYIPDEDDYCYIQVNGKLFKVTRLFVDSKCKSQQNFNDIQSEMLMNIAEIRVKALEKISTSTVIKSAFVKADYIVACAPSALKKYESNAKKKRSRLSKKSESTGTGLQYNKDYLNSFPVNNNKRFSDNFSSLSASSTTSIQVPVNPVPDIKPVKPKKVKKEGRINSTITAWYGAASGLSSNSFFANGLPLPRRRPKTDKDGVHSSPPRSRSRSIKEINNKSTKENKS